MARVGAWTWTTLAVIPANAAATACLLWGERMRLPLQNVVALGVVSAVLGGALEWGLAASGPSGWAWTRLATGWPVAWLGARAIARRSAQGSLAARSMVLAALLSPGLGGTQGAWARLGWVALGLLALAPWWIRKPLAPHEPPPRIAAWSAVAAAMAHGMAGVANGTRPGLGGWLAVAGPLAAAAWLGWATDKGDGASLHLRPRQADARQGILRGFSRRKDSR